ncbi:hypothetical protein [Janibacter anophelis]|uniref:hypothetical protein n=1 Tax=Janibacter anophelis TaxID=319054 RepID=UPI000DEFF6B6|nr:hypothetical protein [Janibacter anophelis]
MSALAAAITETDVRSSIDSAKASLEKAAEQIVWQIENRVWTVLGYDSWNEMREAEYGGAAFMVPKAERPELVARMRAQGLTQQEIADTAGVSQTQVQRDLNTQMGNDRPAVVTNARGQQRPASYQRHMPEAPTEEQDAATLARSQTARPEPTVADAVAEFPDLAYYAGLGHDRDVLNMAGDLRRFRERDELDARLDNLRRAIAVDKAKRDGTYRAGMTAVLGEDGEYHMEALAEPATIARTCPTCDGRGVVREQP